MYWRNYLRSKGRRIREMAGRFKVFGFLVVALVVAGLIGCAPCGPT
jgi:hypothetical protein